MPSQRGIQPVAVALAWLQQHDGVLTGWGGVDHVDGRVRAPFPHLRVTAGPGGGLRDGLWVRDQEVRLEGYSALDGSPGEFVMSDLLLLAVGALMELQDRDHSPTDPVISRVRPVGAPGRQTQGVGGLGGQQLTSGQVLYATSVMVTGRPPLA